jgi:hypothetical protein
MKQTAERCLQAVNILKLSQGINIFKCYRFVIFRFPENVVMFLRFEGVDMKRFTGRNTLLVASKVLVY